MLTALWLAACTHAAPVAEPPAPERRRVWLDVDPSVGLPGKDIDDGLALLMALGAPELEVVGVSVVFGNAPVDEGHAIAADLLARFGPPHLVPVAGAASPSDPGDEVVDALAAALADAPLTLLALGPLTHVARLTARHPGAAARLEEVVAVAGRLPGQLLQTGAHRHRDFNVEQDGDAVDVVLASGAPLTLAPWELSRQVWLGEATLSAWAAGAPSQAWLAERSASWLALWRDRFGADGFNPFDALAVELLVRPDLVACRAAAARLVIGPDDRGRVDPPPAKPYLWVEPGAEGRPVRWCDRAGPSIAEDIARRAAVPAP